MSELSRRAFLGGVAATAAVASLPIPKSAPLEPIAIEGIANLKVGDVITIAGLYASRWDVTWGEAPLRQFKVVASSSNVITR